MQVYLDDLEVSAAAASLGEALRAGVAAAESKGRVVVEIKADGVAVGDEQLERAEEPFTARELRLISADPRTLVRVTLHDAADVLDEAKRLQDAAAQLIQTGDTQAALEKLGEVVAVWQLVLGTLDKSGELLKMRLDAIVVKTDDAGGEGRIADEIDALKSSLVSIKRALTQQDWSGLSDALAYELDGRVARWRCLLRALADHVQAPR